MRRAREGRLTFMSFITSELGAISWCLKERQGTLVGAVLTSYQQSEQGYSPSLHGEAANTIKWSVHLSIFTHTINTVDRSNLDLIKN